MSFQLVPNEKKKNLPEPGRKKMFLIAPILFLYYELSLCPLILNYKNIYLLSSLIAKSIFYATKTQPDERPKNNFRSLAAI